MRELVADAEAIALPLSDVASFRAAAPRIEASILTKVLAERLSRRSPTLRAQRIGTALWNDGSDVLEHIRRHSQQLLRRDGATWRLVPDRDEPGSEVLKWRWLSLLLPAGILTTAAHDGWGRPSERVALLDRVHAPVGPVAHQHLHAGACVPFEVLWTRRMSHPSLKGVAKDGDAAALLGPGGFAQWLLRCAIARLTLAGRGDHDPLWLNALEELEHGRLREPTGKPHRDRREVLLRRRIEQKGRTGRPRHNRTRTLLGLNDIWSDDPLYVGARWPEGRLLADMFTACPRPRLFLQYLRLKTLLFNHLVSDGTRPGLSAFTRLYDRIRNYASDLDESTIAAESIGAEEDLDVRSIELRRAPPRTTVGHRAVARSLHCLQGREKGWTFHLIRAKPNNWTGGASTGDAGRRLVAQARNHDRAIRPWVRALTRYPDLLKLIRGVDIAGNELEGPLWTAVEAIAKVRRAANRAAGRTGIPDLRVTLHAGEDFETALGGLRQTWEPIGWALLRPGDRLGHAIALARTCAAGRCWTTRWRRLLDVVWALHFAGRHLPGSPAGLLLRLQQEARVHSSALWTRAPAQGELEQLLLQLGDPTPFHLRNPLLWAMVNDRVVASKAIEPICIDIDEVEANWTNELQRSLRGLVARSGIVVESNPSSNLLVAHLSAPLDLPPFRLLPVDLEHDGVEISVSADDPLSFASSLGDEYAYAWAGMVVAGSVAPRRATAWLQAVATASWRSRFTLPDPSTTSVANNHLL